jgi:hypothetical protein
MSTWQTFVDECRTYRSGDGPIVIGPTNGRGIGRLLTAPAAWPGGSGAQVFGVAILACQANDEPGDHGNVAQEGVAQEAVSPDGALTAMLAGS